MNEVEIASRCTKYGQPCAFVDRDGTIISERHYLADPNDVELETNAAKGLHLLQSMGYMLIIVSNQSGIGRGILSRDQVDAVNQRVNELLLENNIKIAGWYFCPHSPTVECNCRKPKRGLVDKAMLEHHIDISQSFVIGDKDVDLGLASSCGLPGHLVLTGYGIKYANWASANGFESHADLLKLAEHVQQRRIPALRAY